MNRFNKETLVKFIILICCSIFYIKFTASGDILKFMHPRLLPFVNFSIILMIIISLSLVVNLKKDRTRPAYINGYKLFIIPLLIVLLLDPAKDLANMQPKDTQYAKKDNMQNLNNENISTKEQENNEDKDEEINKDGPIVITDENYLATLDKIYNEKDKYVNRKVVIKGFVFKNKTINGNNFVIARYVMTCCASDMQVVGLLCRSNKEYKENSWHEITGTLKKADNSDELLSIFIEVESSKEIEIPTNQYIYPN